MLCRRAVAGEVPPSWGLGVQHAHRFRIRVLYDRTMDPSSPRFGSRVPPAATIMITTVAPCAATRARIMCCANTLFPLMKAPNPTHSTETVVMHPIGTHGSL
mmetsp:Transcript_29288/g.61332  ORF Transcript_29288/g.61332 Transcript_29288/m.61332 type:complete len:102 (-) Transcript_29288:93-398(-)